MEVQVKKLALKMVWSDGFHAPHNI